jgi:plastocyanin
MRAVVHRRALSIAGGLLALTALSACGGAVAGYGGPAAPSSASATAQSPSAMPMTMPPSQGSGVASAPMATDQVAIAGFAFGPQAVTVKVGTTVTWSNQDEDSHTVTADDRSFTSQALGNGQTFTHTFTTPGTYAYHCSIHPFMHGTVVVTNG